MKRLIALSMGLVAGMLIDCALAQVPSPLLAIDQHRATVVERIVKEWGDKLTATSAGVNREQLHEMLYAMRADQLLAASLAGSIEGLRDVLAHALTTAAMAKPGLQQAKALGDTGDDVVYTPVTPCRLVETRGTFAAVYQTGGAYSGGEIRNYAVQGGNGVCLIQLPGSLGASAVQLQVFGIPINSGASGDIEILPQGSTFGATATEVYVGNVAFNTVSTTAKINLVNNQIGVQVRGGGADVAIDVVGYFKRSGNYGGTHTITGAYATDSGGFGNTVSGDYSTVAGGAFNAATLEYSAVSGGYSNQTSGGGYSVIAGGRSNSAGNIYSTVAGGVANTASGIASTVAGGNSNTASGSVSFAAGSFANAAQNGCFVFGDNSTTNGVTCGLPNQFVTRAVGGVYFLTAGNSNATYTGATLLAGATAWTVFSDSTGKDNIQPIDSVEVLRKVAAMPIATWNWKSQDASIRHMGPMAQDFRAAFGLGETPKGISTVDADGVALAAIQGLHQLVEEKDARIATLERAVGELQRALEGLALKH
jgi:hypothetical protein